MTKEEIKGQVLLKVSGGEPSSDVSVWIDDIDTLIAPAVNFVQLKQYYADKQDEGERLIQPFMLQVYENVAIQKNTDRNQFYITLPKSPQSLPNGRALNYLGTMKGERFIPLAQGTDGLQKEYAKYKTCITSYQPEGLKCFLWNVPALLDKVLIKMLVNVKDIADTDEIILPSGGELEVINLIYEWLSGQRATPKDIVIDQKDKQIA
jgi:hypothetical protein